MNEAEKYAAEDEIAKGKIAAKNSFESYIFNVKNTLDDEKLKVGGPMMDGQITILKVTIFHH